MWQIVVMLAVAAGAAQQGKPPLADWIPGPAPAKGPNAAPAGPAPANVAPANPAPVMQTPAEPTPARPAPAPAPAPPVKKEPKVTQDSPSSAAPALSASEWKFLEARGWRKRVGTERGVWVSIARQQMYVIERNACVWSGPCGTAEAGAGARAGSNQTPTGWHRVAEKIGAGAPWGQVFRSRKATNERWKPGMDAKEDLVLSRILWLEGMEQGINRGAAKDGVSVDSHKRYIYIHGTNGEERIGQPSSHGCVRLLNDDVIKIFEMLPEGTMVLITE